MSNLVFNTPYGQYNIVKAEINRYASNNALAIELYCEDEDGFVEPFARLTTNLEGYELPDNCAFVDTNNLPNAEDFIVENELGKPTGHVGQSGWCTYPLYEFDLDKLRVV